MDLTRRFPRSPYDMGAGLVMLPRTTDKARAHLAGRLGEYLYDCPLDQLLFEFLGVDADGFLNRVAGLGDDGDVATWIDRDFPRTEAEKDAFNNRLRHQRPEGEDGARWLAEQQERLGRSDYQTYFEHLDADEGRF